MEDNIKKFEGFLDRMQGLLDNAKKQGHIIVRVEDLENAFPELKEREDERIRKMIINHLTQERGSLSNEDTADAIKWLEKQGNIDLEFFENGENEKREFVGYGFLKCKGDFLSFKEGETYWLEYVGKDNYNVRSDNLLGQTFHITPQQLYTVFRPTTWLEKQGQQDDYNDNIITRDDEILQAISIGLTDAEKDLGWSDFGGLPIEEIHAWLERQGEQKPVDKAEPKFHEGDWVVRGDTIAQILDIQEQYYVGLDIDGNDFTSSRFLSDDKIHLYTIQDAKNGDVLASGHLVFIFKVIHGVWLNCHCSAHNDGSFIADSYDLMTNKYFSEVHPATKEQRDLLFQKMEESNYKWDAEKKELRKIEQKLASSAKTCKNDTLLDLLNKMPSYITVDGLDYHFVLKKIGVYIAYYECEGEEGRDKIIFWMAGDPVDLLTAMPEKLKEGGLLE